MNVSCLNVNPAGPVAQSRNPAALAIAVNLPEAFRADLALYLKREGLSCLEASERLGEMLNRHIDERTLYRWQEPNGYPVPLNAAVLNTQRLQGKRQAHNCWIFPFTWNPA